MITMQGGWQQRMSALLFNIWVTIQHTIFPWMGEVLEPLTEKQREFVRVIELAEIEKHIQSCPSGKAA